MSPIAPPAVAISRVTAARAAACLLAGMVLVVALGVSAQAWEAGTDGLLPIPPLTARITDLTRTLSSAESAALEAKLADWESRTSNQLVVLIVPTTQPEPIEAYSIRAAEKWKIGRKGQDNGALFLIAKNDRKMRIEVGYGLEGTLTDVTSRRIIAEDVAPAFREGRFAAGINAGVDRIISVVGEGKPLPPPKPATGKSPARGFSPDVWLFLAFAVITIGGILRAIFGRLLGSTVGAGLAAAVAWFIAGSLVLAVILGLAAFLVIILFGTGLGGMGRGGGISTGGGWGGGGGGFSGGGGSFGGGGASGNW